MMQPFTHVQGTSCRLNGHLLVLLALWTITACVSAPQLPQNEPLPPPENATPPVAPLLLDGNRLFAEHRWTSAIIKYEKAVRSQPTLAEAHYNLDMALYKNGPVSAARPHFIEAADLAPGHPVIWNAPPFRKYGTVESNTPTSAPDGHFGHQH
ncbi:tetratricopeptide repeat protein [Nitrospira sp. Ecomares 2.1]